MNIYRYKFKTNLLNLLFGNIIVLHVLLYTSNSTLNYMCIINFVYMFCYIYFVYVNISLSLNLINIVEMFFLYKLKILRIKKQHFKIHIIKCEQKTIYTMKKNYLICHS